MAPVKRRPHTRRLHKMKLRKRKPNISELVYKFLKLDGGEGIWGRKGSKDNNTCRICKLPKRREEDLDYLKSRPREKMANKRKNSVKNSKAYRLKRQHVSKDKNLSAGMSRNNTGGLRRMKRYIQKALDFGVESGYLIPRDSTYKVLRVSSDLMNDVNYANNVWKSDSVVSQVRNKSPRRTPMRLEDYDVQEARRRRRKSRRRRRSRSGSRRRRRSRRRGRRRSGSATGEEVLDMENDEYEYEKQPEKKSKCEDGSIDDTNDQRNQYDREKPTDKRENDMSDLSIDEDESDDEEDKKRNDADKS